MGDNISLIEKFSVKKRMLWIYLVILVCLSPIFINLVKLQIVNGNDNLYLSSSIKTTETIIRAPRGVIYDRNGNILVRNKPSYQLVIDLKTLPVEKEDSVIEILAGILGVDTEEFRKDFKSKIYTSDNKRVDLSTVTLLRDIGRDAIVSIESRKNDLPGISVIDGTTREYVDGSYFAHIVGYIREVSKSEIDTGKYFLGDTIGSSGIEQYYDDTLRGENGAKITETDRDLTEIRELLPAEPISGENLQLTIDMEMQKKLTEYLSQGIEKTGANAGSAIIMDVTNGEIISMVSLPSYDPNKIIKGLSAVEYDELVNDPALPLYNRAISHAQPPGSTFKTVVLSAALADGAITDSTIFRSDGCMDLGGGYEFCEVGKVKMGDLDLYKAITRSSNTYPCNVMMKLGIDRLDYYALEYNLGSKTGIDLFGESSGVLASKAEKLAVTGEPWYLGDSCNTAIGQGDMMVTPLQMISWVSTIANGGTYYKPHIAKAVLNKDLTVNQSFDSEIIRQISITDNDLAKIRKGMHLVVNGSGGSAFPLRGVESDPAAKTGSAEVLRKINGVYEKSAQSWITGFFPYEEPKYAFVVYLEYGGWGYQSAYVMKDFFTWYDAEYK